eukprot:1750475-Prymnesium_polylepis.1
MLGRRVNEYTSLYTKDQLQLVPQEQPWGLTEQVSATQPPRSPSPQPLTQHRWGAQRARERAQ